MDINIDNPHYQNWCLIWYEDVENCYMPWFFVKVDARLFLHRGIIKINHKFKLSLNLFQSLHFLSLHLIVTKNINYKRLEIKIKIKFKKSNVERTFWGLTYYDIVNLSLQAFQYQKKPGIYEMIKCCIRPDVLRALIFTHLNPVMFQNNSIF